MDVPYIIDIVNVVLSRELIYPDTEFSTLMQFQHREISVTSLNLIPDLPRNTLMLCQSRCRTIAGNLSRLI